SRRRETPMPPSPPGSRAQRRVARTKAAIEDAFVALVLERGYERVAVEDIADRADLARATFYAHYPNKQAVLFSVSNHLTQDLMQRIAHQDRPPKVARWDAIQTAYRHAADKPDLYRACMSDARTRQAYLSALTRYAEQNIRDRLQALSRPPRVPIPVMARGFVGAHLAIVEAWLAGELHGDIEELASTATGLLVAGAAGAAGSLLHDARTPTGPPADPRPPSPPQSPQPRRGLPASPPPPEAATNKGEARQYLPDRRSGLTVNP